MVALDFFAKTVHHLVKPFFQISFIRIFSSFFITEGLPLPFAAVIVNKRAGTKVCSSFVKLFVRTEAANMVLAHIFIRKVARRPATTWD